MKSYLEILNELTQEIGKFFNSPYTISIKKEYSEPSELGKNYDDEYVSQLMKLNKGIFSVAFRLNSKHYPEQGISCCAISDSIDTSLRNSIELLMHKIKNSGHYYKFCSLDVFKGMCFFTPYGMFWNDWKTTDRFICKNIKGCRVNSINPDKWGGDSEKYMDFLRENS